MKHESLFQAILQSTVIFIAGLDNSMVENEDSFNSNLCTLLNTFLKRQKEPICLVAHNGHGYDFPLLRAELCAIHETLPSSVLCADSLPAFRAVHSASNSELKGDCEKTPSKRISYSLENVYKRTMGVCMTNAHNAESDCLALVQVCHKTSQTVLPWFDLNAQAFDTIKPMYTQ